MIRVKCHAFASSWSFKKLKPLVVGGNQDLAATEHCRDEPGNSAPMIGIVGGDDVIQRDNGRADIKLLDRRHSQRQRHRMDL